MLCMLVATQFSIFAAVPPTYVPLEGYDYSLAYNLESSPNTAIVVGTDPTPGVSSLPLTIPDVVKIGGVDYTVSKIANNAFEGNTAITSLKIGDNVTTLGDASFRGCTNLTKVVIGDGIVNLSNNTFEGCTSLEKVVMGRNVTVIGGSTFSGCTDLAEVTPSYSLYSIGISAFSETSALKRFEIPASFTRFYAAAFAGSGLEELYFLGKAPKSVASAFNGVDLKELHIPNGATASDYTAIVPADADEVISETIFDIVYVDVENNDPTAGDKVYMGSPIVVSAAAGLVPPAGYKFAGVKVKSADGSFPPFAATAVTGGYSFVQPSYAVKVMAEYTPESYNLRYLNNVEVQRVAPYSYGARAYYKEEVKFKVANLFNLDSLLAIHKELKGYKIASLTDPAESPVLSDTIPYVKDKPFYSFVMPADSVEISPIIGYIDYKIELAEDHNIKSIKIATYDANGDGKINVYDASEIEVADFTVNYDNRVVVEGVNLEDVGLKPANKVSGSGILAGNTDETTITFNSSFPAIDINLKDFKVVYDLIDYNVEFDKANMTVKKDDGTKIASLTTAVNYKDEIVIDTIASKINKPGYDLVGIKVVETDPVDPAKQKSFDATATVIAGETQYSFEMPAYSVKLEPVFEPIEYILGFDIKEFQRDEPIVPADKMYRAYYDETVKFKVSKYFVAPVGTKMTGAKLEKIVSKEEVEGEVDYDTEDWDVTTLVDNAFSFEMPLFSVKISADLDSIKYNIEHGVNGDRFTLDQSRKGNPLKSGTKQDLYPVFMNDEITVNVTAPIGQELDKIEVVYIYRDNTKETITLAEGVTSFSAENADAVVNVYFKNIAYSIKQADDTEGSFTSMVKSDGKWNISAEAFFKDSVEFIPDAVEGKNVLGVSYKPTGGDVVKIVKTKDRKFIIKEMPAANIDVTVKYGWIPLDVRYYSSEIAFEGGVKPYESHFGEEVKFTISENYEAEKGMKLIGWNVDEIDANGKVTSEKPFFIPVVEGQDEYKFTMPLSDVRISAVVENIDYEVKSLDGNAKVTKVMRNGNVVEDPKEFYVGDKVFVEVAQRDGQSTKMYLYIAGTKDLYKGPFSVENPEFTMPPADLDIKVVYGNNTYKVENKDNVVLSDKDGYYEYGEDVTVTYKPTPGMKFVRFNAYQRYTPDNKVEVTENKDKGEGTFKMPAYGVHVEAIEAFIEYSVTCDEFCAVTKVWRDDVEYDELAPYNIGDVVEVSVDETQIPEGYILEKILVNGREVKGKEVNGKDVTYIKIQTEDVKVVVIIKKDDYAVELVKTKVTGVLKDGSQEITSFSKNAQMGDLLYLEPEDEKGKEFVEFVATNLDTKETVEVVNQYEGEYYITMPAARVKIEARYKTADYTITCEEGASVKYIKRDGKDVEVTDPATAQMDDIVKLDTTAPDLEAGYKVYGYEVYFINDNAILERVKVNEKYIFVMPPYDVTVTPLTRKSDYQVNTVGQCKVSKILRANGSMVYSQIAQIGDLVYLKSTASSAGGREVRFVATDEDGNPVEVKKTDNGAWYFENPASQVTVRSISSEQKFAVTVVGGTANVLEASAGEFVKLTPTDFIGKVFTSWSSTPDLQIIGGYFEMPTCDVTITANFAAAKYNLNGVEGVVFTQQEIVGDEFVTKVVTSAAAGKAVYVSYESEKDVKFISSQIATIIQKEGENNAVFSMPAKSVFVDVEEVRYDYKEYANLTIINSTGAVVEEESTYEVGKELTFSIPAGAGYAAYQLVDRMTGLVFAEINAAGEFVFDMPAVNTILVVKYIPAANYYNVSLEGVALAGFYPSGVYPVANGYLVAAGTKLSLLPTAVPAGFTLSGLSVNGYMVDAATLPMNITVNNDLSIVAIMTRMPYVITGSGTWSIGRPGFLKSTSEEELPQEWRITRPGEILNAQAYPGEVVTVVAADAPEGYVFSHWVSEEVVVEGDAEGTFIMPEGDVSIEAVFTRVVGLDAAEGEAVKIFASNGQVIVEGAAQGAAIQVYSAAGVLVVSAEATDEARQAFPLSQGTYIVRVADVSTMVVL